MRYIHRKQWKEILVRFPSRQVNDLKDWNERHWSQLRVNLPQLSRPWSSEKRGKLYALKDKSGLFWSDVQKEFPGRSQAQIEFELLRLWVGEEIWNESGKDQDEEAGQDRLGDLLDDSQ